MSPVVEGLIVILGGLVMALVSFRMSRDALVTGVAPLQLVSRAFGLKLITRKNNKFGFWYLTIPAVVLFVWSIVVLLFSLYLYVEMLGAGA